jgi:hypothetical protein
MDGKLYMYINIFIFVLLLKIIIINYYRTSIVQEHWSNFILTTPIPVFVSAKPTGEIEQNATNISSDMDEIMSTLDIDKLSAVITDNASVMKSAWRILAIKYPSVIFMGCLAHSLNLLINDIIKLNWAKTIISKAKVIVKYFKFHHIPAAILKRHQKATYKNTWITLKLPVKTRWGSNAACLASLKANHLALGLATHEISTNSNIIINEEIKNNIFNENFWKEITGLLAVLEKIAIGITIFESDTSKLSYFYEWYESLENSEGEILFYLFFIKYYIKIK